MKKLLLFVFVIVSASLWAQVPTDPTKTNPIQKGEKAPDAAVKSVDDEKLQLNALMKGKKTLLIFYRGGWCPFCNVHLAELMKIDQQLTDNGVQILAVSADSPKDVAKTVQKKKMNYTVLSDYNAEASKAYGLAFAQKKDFILPVPSVYIIDEEMNILFQHSNPDYTKRLSKEEILEALNL